MHHFVDNVCATTSFWWQGHKLFCTLPDSRNVNAFTVQANSALRKCVIHFDTSTPNAKDSGCWCTQDTLTMRERKRVWNRRSRVRVIWDPWTARARGMVMMMSSVSMRLGSGRGLTEACTLMDALRPLWFTSSVRAPETSWKTRLSGTRPWNVSPKTLSSIAVCWTFFEGVKVDLVGSLCNGKDCTLQPASRYSFSCKLREVAESPFEEIVHTCFQDLSTESIIHNDHKAEDAV